MGGTVLSLAMLVGVPLMLAAPALAASPLAQTDGGDAEEPVEGGDGGDGGEEGDQGDGTEQPSEPEDGEETDDAAAGEEAEADLEPGSVPVVVWIGAGALVIAALVWGVSVATD